jgi:hypothetical protein
MSTKLSSGADKTAAKGSLALHRLSSSTSFYSSVSFDDTGEEVIKTDKAAAMGSLALHRLSSSTSFYSSVSFDDTGEEVIK